MTRTIALLLPMLSAAAAFADTKPADTKPAGPQTLKCRVTGLFCPSRQDDLRKTLETLPAVTLTALDYDNAEATFTFEPAKAFPGAKPDKYIERLDSALQHASYRTFGARLLSDAPKEKLAKTEIGVIGLDCKGCSFAAYQAVYKIEGVDHAVVDFKQGVVTAWIDPAKTNSAALEEALKKKQVKLKTPEAAKKP